MTFRSGINFKKQMHRLIKHSKRPVFTCRNAHDSYEFSPTHMHYIESSHDSFHHHKSMLSKFVSKNSAIIASAAVGILGAAAIGISMQRAPKKKSWFSMIENLM